MFSKKTIRDVDLKGKKALVRVDFNVPLTLDRKVADDTRIRAVLPTLKYLKDQGGRAILVSHLGRPNGQVDEAVRLDPIAERLSELLGTRVKKVDKTVTSEVCAMAASLNDGDVMLLENVRFNPGEKENDRDFAAKLASVADIFVNDAFGTAHRSHASTVGVTEFLPSYAGFLLETEVRELSRMLDNPKKPFMAVLGGNKVSDKIGVIDKFLDIVDAILTGGGMCFSFLKAKGKTVGDSICQDSELEHCKAMMEKANKNGVDLLLPVDVVIAKEMSGDSEARVVTVDQIPNGWMCLDIGPKTIEIYKDYLARAKTIFWNGPMGVFEIDKFANGTRSIAAAVVGSGATSIVGGGDSDAALRKFDLEDRASFVSTGGGASLKLLEGSLLPGLEALLDA